MSREAVREALRQAPDGKTLCELARIVRKPHGNILQAIEKMPDVYIDRWAPAKSGRWKYAAVYVAVEVPEDAPKPD